MAQDGQNLEVSALDTSTAAGGQMLDWISMSGHEIRSTSWWLGTCACKI